MSKHQAKRLRSNASKPPSASSKPTRSTSHSGSAAPEPLPTPETPRDSTLPVKAPLNAHAAKTFLHAHGYLDTSTEISTAGILSNVLTGIARHPNASEFICALITSVNLLLPEAFKLVCTTNKQLSNISEKLDTLISNSDREPAAPPPPPPALAELEHKLDKVSQDIQQATVAWKTVPTRSRSREPTSPGCADPTPDPVPRQQPPAVPVGPSHAELTRQKRLQSQGCFVLVEPSGQSLESLSARVLAQKAELAWDAAWDAVKGKEFVKELGLTAKPRMVFKAPYRLPRGGVRYKMEDRTQAALLSDARIAIEFEKGFGGATCKGQGATILLQSASVDYKPEDPAAIPNFERENQLNPGDVLSMTWCKPIHKRRLGQEVAVLKLEMRSHDLADRLITSGGQLNYVHVRFSKAKQEPMRCHRCQTYGHKVVKCISSTHDVCSQCGGAHRIADCDNKEKKWCVPCKSDTHCSFDRACPTFRVECEKFNQRKPENRSLLFGAPHPSNPAPHLIYHLTPELTTLWPEGGYTSLAVAQNAAYRAMERPLYQPRGPVPRKQMTITKSWNTGNVRTAPRIATQATRANAIRVPPTRPPVACESTPFGIPNTVPVTYYSPSAPVPATPQQPAVHADTPASPFVMDLPTLAGEFRLNVVTADTVVTPNHGRRYSNSSIASTITLTP